MNTQDGGEYACVQADDGCKVAESVTRSQCDTTLHGAVRQLKNEK